MPLQMAWGAVDSHSRKPVLVVSLALRSTFVFECMVKREGDILKLNVATFQAIKKCFLVSSVPSSHTHQNFRRRL